MDIKSQPTPADKSDLAPDGWIIRILPAPLQPLALLMRLDRPIGTWLLLLPGWWAIALAYNDTRDLGLALKLAILFAVGAVLMRGAGCVVNDLWDRDIDGQVERTRHRPLVTGAVRVREAILLIIVLSLMGLNILLLMNGAALWVGLASIPFILIYPWMKRITWWPQLMLGLTFNFGALMGWAAMTGHIGIAAVLLYLAGIFWTLGYDTIYAHMDRVDDETIGIKSSARKLGDQTRPALIWFYSLASVLIFLALYSAAPSLWALPGMAVIGNLFAYQIRQLDIHDPARCLALFRFNRDQGLIILAIIILCSATA